jgi:hypothetical protein
LRTILRYLHWSGTNHKYREIADAQSAFALPRIWARLSIVRDKGRAKLAYGEVVMMFIWLVPLGIVALLLLYIFGKSRT